MPEMRVLFWLRESEQAEMTSPEFTQLIDRLVLMADTDPELKAGFEWIEERARKEGVSTYEIAFRVCSEHMANKLAREWMNGRHT